MFPHLKCHFRLFFPPIVVKKWLLITFSLLMMSTLVFGFLFPVFAETRITETVVTSLSTGDDYAQSIALLDDGNFLVAGRAFNGSNYDFAIAKYNSDLTLDTTFGIDGIVMTPVGIENDYIHDIAVQDDGKIVAVGQVHQPTRPWNRFGVVRYNPDGSMDPTFGSGGKLIISLVNWTDLARSVVIQPDGKIVVTGYSDPALPGDFATLRFNPDGSLDNTFSDDGKVITSFTSNYDEVYDMLLQPDGKLVLAGIIQHQYGVHKFALARYNPNGTLDSSFGSGGLSVIDFETADLDFGRGVALQADGKIIITGLVMPSSTTVANRHVALARVDTNGILDTTFGDNGKVITDIGNELDDWDGSNRVIIDPETNNILVSGASNHDAVVLQYDANGVLDQAFGNNGFYSVDYLGGDDFAADLVITQDRSIVAIGSAHNGHDYDFGILKLSLNQPPTADAGGPYEGNEGDSITLDASGSSDLDGTITLYEWDLDNDGEFDDATGVTTEVVFGDNDTFIVGLRVTDEFGENDTDTAEVTVNNLAPSVTLDTSGAIAFAGGDAFLGRKGVEQTHQAVATDPGSDDLVFNWSFGATTTYFNDGVGPDPFPSPAGIFPFEATDVTNVTFGMPGVQTVDVEVVDDDGGTASGGQPKLVTDDSECTTTQGLWKHQFGEKGKHQIDDAILEAYLGIVNFASTVFSEQVPASTIEEARAVMEVSDPALRNNAEAQLLAAWLNFAQGAVGWDELIDTDGDGTGDTPLHQVMSEAETLLLNTDATHEELEHAKDLAEAVNLHDEGNPVCVEGGNDTGGGGECDFKKGGLALDVPGQDFDKDGNPDLAYVSEDFMGNPGAFIATEDGSYCDGGVGSGNRIATVAEFGITDFCSIEMAVNFVPGSENIGTYFTYTGGNPGDIFIVRSFNGNKYYKIELTEVSSSKIQFKWAEVNPPECETCVPGQEGMGICF